ncbi:uncharacterized protein A4U43_C10F18080 [Asparagus officinalis]|uniref:Uncharacterized protein n=1 Tax=Asparagus officinalis TaxID=4686 RepID=A0A5P1E3P7_ASPOF|nr:uncharacterized protein A4U43_C10F18080 [Asparagus officinalis]
MYVVKRDGRHEPVHFDKITARLKKLSYRLRAPSTAILCSSPKKSARGPTRQPSRLRLGIIGPPSLRSDVDFLNFDGRLTQILDLDSLRRGLRIKVMYHHYNERSGLEAPLIADDVYEIIMKGLKTGMYYLRSRAAADEIKLTVDISLLKKEPVEEDNLECKMAQVACSLENREECMACGS